MWRVCRFTLPQHPCRLACICISPQFVLLVRLRSATKEAASFEAGKAPVCLNLLNICCNVSDFSYVILSRSRFVRKVNLRIHVAIPLRKTIGRENWEFQVFASYVNVYVLVPNPFAEFLYDFATLIFTLDFC